VSAAPEVEADAPAEAAPAASPFTMLIGDPDSMVCEGDVCYIPGTSQP
jgi:hypothetical protein